MKEVTYWKKEMETLPREELEVLQLQKFRERMQYVSEKSLFYKKKYDEAGIKYSDIQTLDDIQDVPFTVKEELRESQVRQPPWGDFICIPPEEGVRVFQTTGTTGIPVRAILNKTDWFVHYYEQFMHFMYGYGIKKSDILFVPFGYGLYMAWSRKASPLSLVVPRLLRIGFGTYSIGGLPWSAARPPISSISEIRPKRWAGPFPIPPFALLWLPVNRGRMYPPQKGR